MRIFEVRERLEQFFNLFNSVFNLVLNIEGTSYGGPKVNKPRIVYGKDPKTKRIIVIDG